MNAFIALSDNRRRLICEQGQSRLGLPAASLEKDFWVCWTLKQLFELEKWGQNLTFKGGTSLSKGWGLIDRFSEDIDIVIDRGFLGFDGEKSPEAASSQKKRKFLLDAMRMESQNFIHNDLKNSLTRVFRDLLPSGYGWNLESAPEEEDPTGQTLLFHYPDTFAGRAVYVRPVVKIEMGARSDNEPAETPIIHPYLFDVFPDVLGPSDFPVRALSPERTFWEKAMLLHEETYRPKGKKRQQARLARHYYDLWCLILRGIAEKAVKREDIFKRTVAHREIYFKWNWMDYTTLKKGSLRIIPSAEDLNDWRRDYRAMSSEMFFGKVPDFDEIIRVISDFEDSFNSPDPCLD